MEKNERLASRTKPRTHIAGAFPAAQSAIAMGDPSNCKCQKTTFQSLKSCFLIFPSRHPWEQAVSFSGAFPAAQSAIAWETLPTGKFQKTTFQSLKSCWQPFQLANFKKQLFRAWKVVFWFSPPDTLESRQWAFQVLFQLPKAQLQWEALPTGNFSEPEKLCFDFTFQNPQPWSQKGSGRLCHRPTPGHMFEPAWSHKNRENSESWWNEAR